MCGIVMVDLANEKLSLSVREFKLEMVFDDVLEGAARALASGEAWNEPEAVAPQLEQSILKGM